MNTLNIVQLLLASSSCYSFHTNVAYTINKNLRSSFGTSSLHATKAERPSGGGGFGKKKEASSSSKDKSKVFESLLRDLQIEDVPLLGCDAKDVSTLNAAIYTTLAEMSESDEVNKSCMIFENIPLDALKSFANDFITLKMQYRLAQFLPELERINVSMLSGSDKEAAGPAIILETTQRSEKELDEKKEREDASMSSMNEVAVTSAVKHFVDRMVVGEAACPYTKSADIGAVGLEAKGVTPGSVGYRFSTATDCTSALASFWTSICELQSTPEADLSTIVLSLPGIGNGLSKASHDRFCAVVEIVSRSLCLFRGDDVFGLVHFHPAYDRNLVNPIDKPAYGHLPPRCMSRPMFKHMGNPIGETLTDEQLNLSDYQRRAPVTAINILRASQIDAAAGPKSIVDLDMGDGETQKASGLNTYTRNALRLAEIGEDPLRNALNEEIEMSKGN